MALQAVHDDNGDPLPVLGQGAQQEVVVGAASAQSTALGAGTLVVRLCATTACRILFGTNPTAAATSTLLPANVVEFWKIPGAANGTMKIAVIQESAGGKLSITEMI